MKKTISINISGTIFNIDEDGYEKLYQYLSLINKHFSSYEEKEEIVKDIESRIAELFLEMLGKSRKVITIKDVEKLISIMGDISDFEAIEDEQSDNGSGTTEKEKKKESKKSQKPTKLFRDGKRKILGGVATGIAYYFQIDPVWIRLLFIILTLGFFIIPPISGFMIFSYIVLWIILPESEELKDEKKIKKLYRDHNKMIIGGVASGIAAYFGIDVALIRLLFVISILFAGSGIIAYIVLWIITPEAKTITEKMEMQGEPLTLSNIVSNIKKNLNVKDIDGEESLLAKIVLFPFRLLAQIFNWIEKNLIPMIVALAEGIRILAGIFLVLISGILILAILITFSVALGFFTFFNWMFLYDLPLDIIHGTMPLISTFSGFFLLLTPSVFLGLLGIILLAKRNIINPVLGWIMTGVWFLSIIGIGISVPLIAKNFRSEGYYKTSKEFHIEKDKILYLAINDAGNEHYKRTTLKLRGHDEPYLKLVQKFEARGFNKKDAINNAKMLTYHVVFNDSILLSEDSKGGRFDILGELEGGFSILTFDSNFDFKDSAKFRVQSLDMVLYLPYKKTFFIDDKLTQIIRSTIHKYGYNTDQIEGNKWNFTKDGLKCLTCPSYKREDSPLLTGKVRKEGEKYIKEFQVTGFTKLNIGSAFVIDVRRGENFKVVISSENNKDIEEVYVIVDDDELEIDYESSLFNFLNINIDKNNFNFNRNNMKVSIIMPEISEVYFHGASTSSIKGFDQEEFYIKLSGASQSNIDILAEKLEIEMSGASELSLTGSGYELETEVSGASELNAYKFKVKKAYIETSGASDVKIFVTEKIIIESSGMSDVNFKGDPGVVVVERRR